MDIVSYYLYILLKRWNFFDQASEAEEYTDRFSAELCNPPPSECPRYDTKQSDSGVSVMLELWGMQSTPLLPSVSCSLWPGVEVLDRVLSVG